MENRLWYAKQAEAFEEALPLGNGKLGAMVYGKTGTEKISLNADTLWSGHPEAKAEGDPYDAYLRAKQAFREDKRGEAEEILRVDFAGLRQQSYLPAGNLWIQIGEPNSTGYKRELDLENAIATCAFDGEKIHIESTCFVSAIDHVLVYRVNTSAPHAFRVSMDAQLKYSISQEQGILLLSGQAYDEGVKADSYDRDDTIRYTIAALPVTDGKLQWQEDGVCVENATELTLYLSIQTSFVAWNKIPDGEHRSVACETVKRAAEKGYLAAKDAHTADFSGYYNRIHTNFAADAVEVPTDERIKAEKKDVGLVELLFNYGRYLVIASSRSGSMATNLQGIWNEKLMPPWASGYTTNINTEMNYWPVLMCNLPEFMDPLFDLIHMVVESGRETAKRYYHCDGFTAHHNYDIWGKTSPAEGSPQWLYWCMSSGWMCRHLFEYYEYTGDLAFLENTALPIMEEAAKFYRNLLEEQDGKWVISPSTSPENSYFFEGNETFLAGFTTMTQAILMDLFGNIEKACAILGREKPELRPIENLNTYCIGSQGQLLEYDKEYEEVEVHHRHVSHLYGLYPGESITSEDPVLSNACRRSLEIRGDFGTGWAMGWKTNLWAKLKDGDHALRMVENQLRFAESTATIYDGKGGTYTNMFDAHPPFQIDGNFGVAAGIAQMFLQCENGKIKLLPALPDAFREGSVEGLLAKGNVTVSLWWKDHKLCRAELLSQTDQEVQVEIANGKTQVLPLKAGERFEINGAQ